MEQRRICPYCMQELEAGEEQCPHCGRELAGRNPSGSLPAGTVLAGRYTVGDIQSVDGEGILYRGVENNGPFRVTIKEFGGKKIVKLLDYAPGLDGLPKSDVLKFLLEDNCSIVVRPSGTEPKLKTYISISAENKETAEKIEAEICKSAEEYLK